MRKITKTFSTLLAAVFVSGAFAGSALADFPRQSVGDLNGNERVSTRQMQIDNEKALRASRDVVVNKPLGYKARAEAANFPNQAYGDRTGSVRVPTRTLAADREITGKGLLILPFKGDWNGTAKEGFPHQ